MRIQQDHRRTFQSLSGTAGETISPRISTSSLMHPKTSSATEGTGTSFTTGRPFLVTIKGWRVDCTSSIILRQTALNFPAGMVFMTIYRDHSHYTGTHKYVLTAIFSGNHARYQQAPESCTQSFKIRPGAISPTAWPPHPGFHPACRRRIALAVLHRVDCCRSSIPAPRPRLFLSPDIV